MKLLKQLGLVFTALVLLSLGLVSGVFFALLGLVVSVAVLGWCIGGFLLYALLDFISYKKKQQTTKN